MDLIIKIVRKFKTCFFYAIRHIPRLAKYEYYWYSRYERSLFKDNLFKKNTWLFFMLDKSIIRQSISNNSVYRVIDPLNLVTDDIEYLKKSPISNDHILKNHGRFSSKNTKDSFSDPEKDIYDRTFQLDAIESGSIKAVCPISGAVLYSDRSLLAETGNTIFYRFVGYKCVFYLAVGRAGMGYIKSYLYFPEQQAVFLLGDAEWAWLGRWEIDQFRAYLILNYNAIVDYLRKQSTSLCLLIDHDHFAHHIWNNLTGLSKVASRKQLSSIVKKIIIASEPMGRIDSMFPEFEAQIYIRLSGSDVVDRALADNLFLLRPGGTIVTHDVIERLHSIAIKNVSDEYLKSALEFRKNHWPILWATIRTTNRTWLTQAEGIASIANKFQETYPNFSLVVDGFSVAYGQDINKISNGEKVSKTISDEMQIANNIKQLINPSIDAIFLVGRPIFESVVYSRFIDFYVAHHGAIQNKIAWLSGKRGVVHSNSTVTNGAIGGMQYFAAFSSINSGVFPIYLDSSVITDINSYNEGSNLRWNFAHQNYEFDRKHAFSVLKAIVLKEPLKNNHFERQSLSK